MTFSEIFENIFRGHESFIFSREGGGGGSKIGKSYAWNINYSNFDSFFVHCHWIVFYFLLKLYEYFPIIIQDKKEMKYLRSTIMSWKYFDVK